MDEIGLVCCDKEKLVHFLKNIKRVVIDNFLLVGFSVALLVSLTYPYPGQTLSSIRVGTMDIKIVEFLNNCMVFLISGLSLKTDDFVELLRHHKRAYIYGMVTINFITTLIAFIMIRLPFPTEEFSVGLAIFCTVPTTLGVGVALTLASKGDSSLALFLTVSSNLLGVITIPFLLKLYIHGTSVNIDPENLAMRLVLTVLIPTIVGICCRRFSQRVDKFMKSYKVEMSLLSNSNLICIVWMALSSSRSALIKQNGPEICLVILAAVLMHVVYLSYNYLVVRPDGCIPSLNFPLKQSIAVTIMSSQKSSPVALAVIANISAQSAQSGLFALPCIIGQLTQIFIGSFVAKSFAKRVTNLEATDENTSVEVADYSAVPENLSIGENENHVMTRLEIEESAP